MIEPTRAQPIPASEASRSFDSASAVPASQVFRKPSRRKDPSLPSPSASLDRSASETRHIAHYQTPLSTTRTQSRPSPHSASSSTGTPGRTHSASSIGSTSRPSSSSSKSPVATKSSPKPVEVTASSNAKPKQDASRQRQSSSAPASSSVKNSGRMLNGELLTSVEGTGGSKSNRILGPDGQLYTQGEAARLGLIIRTACEACRNRKLKCSGTLPENGGCERCNSDSIQCVYSARAPIGRPKKRKMEDGEEALNTPGPSMSTSSPSEKASKPQSAAKHKARKSATSVDELGLLPGRVKVEEPTSLGSPFNSSATPPALQSINSYASGLPSSSSDTNMIVPSPTVWSQPQLAFTTTPSDNLTPHSTFSPPVASHPNTDASHARSAASQSNLASSKLPSLDDLSVAAFLQSLDTLEISPAELFQQQMHQQQQTALASQNASSRTNSLDHYGLMAPLSNADSNAGQWSALSVEEWVTSSAILQPGLSFAVPADFSWWDLGINGVDLTDSVTPSVSATPATELPSMAFPTGSAAPSRAPLPFLQGVQMAGTSSSPAPTSAGSGPGRSRAPTFSADQLWPRGANAGMGQGQIQQTIAATETGLGWSTLPGQHASDSMSNSSVGSPPKETAQKSCCSSKDSKDSAATAAHSEQTSSCCSSKPTTSRLEAETGSTVNEAPCCSLKSKPKDTASKAPEKEASRCSSKKQSSPPSPRIVEPKSCCSGHTISSPFASSASPPTISNGLIEMGPLSTSHAVTGQTSDLHDAERKRHAALHSHHPSKVHCVPNPSGKGCTCLCDMSVALLSVKQVLRETDPHKQPSTTSSDPARVGKGKNSLATDTIQLTLTASQAITAQCACSADCPTCQSDPSTEILASLLVSTALQIYARAVRILREGFAASSLGAGRKAGSEEMGGAGASSAAAAQSFFGGLDVTIGTYKPSASNAKKIALYAIKLELKDLQRALGKISRMAQNLGSAKATAQEATASEGGAQAWVEQSKVQQQQQQQQQGMNPIDQLVILKLYRQLKELLKTVEGLEDAA